MKHTFLIPKHELANIWQISASSLTVEMVSDTDNSSVQMACHCKMQRLCFSKSSRTRRKRILFFATDTSVDWYADQVPCTCSCLLPDMRWSRAASRDSGAVTAETWIKNVANSLQADMYWLVGRVAGLLWFNKRQLKPKSVQTGGATDSMHKHTLKNVYLKVCVWDVQRFHNNRGNC